MEILLIVAIAVVAAAALYVAVTFNARTRQNTAPLVEEAIRKIADQMRASEENMRRQLRAVTDDLQRDREQQRLDGRKIQGRLDHADSRIASMANQFLADLDTIKRRGDQTGEDLRHLDDRVVRLAGSLGQPAGPAAEREPAEPEAAGPEPAASGRLYVERIRFLMARQDLAKPRFRIEVERSVAELPAGQLGGLGDASAVADRAEHDRGFRDRLAEAAADYAAGQWGDPAFAAVTDRWITPNAFPETAAAEVCNRTGNRLNAIVAKPLDTLATDIRLPGYEATAMAGIGADLILQPVAEPLAQAAEFFEIIGVVVGVATGFQPLALAAAKLLAHDKFHDLVSRGIRAAASQVFHGPQPPAQTLDPRPVDQAPRIAAAPVPAQQTPAQKNPTQPDPAQPGPNQPTPTQPNPAQPGPAQPGPTPSDPAGPRRPLTVWDPLPQPRSPEPGSPQPQSPEPGSAEPGSAEPGSPGWPGHPGRPGLGPR